MKCVILAAGYATRLYPLTKNFPKPLLPVAGKPIAQWLTEDLDGTVDGFAVVTNHRFADHFRAWAAAVPQPVTVVDDGTESNETRLGAVRDIQYTLEALKIDGDCLVMAGDNMLDFSLKGFVEYARGCGTSAVMCHEETRLEALQKTAVITVGPDGVITSYEEKPREPKGHLAVPPFYYYRAGDLERIPEALENGCGADAPGSLAAWLSKRTPMHAYRMPGRRYDIGDLAGYERVQALWQEKML